MSESLQLMSWNVRKGGFRTYVPDEQYLGVEDAVRSNAIARFVRSMHRNGVEAVSLSDAYRWDEVYEGEEGIAKHLGYQAARFVRLQDESLMKDMGAGIGIAFATDLPIAESKALDMGTRQGLGVILDIGNDGLQVANVYLDHANQARREAQIRALMHDLEPDMPTIITGDMNMLRPTVNGRVNTVKDFAVGSLLGRVLRGEGRKTVEELNKRTGIRLFHEAGYQDADALRTRATFPAVLPLFGVDYAFTNSQVAVRELYVKAQVLASDHKAVIVDLSV